MFAPTCMFAPTLCVCPNLRVCPNRRRSWCPCTPSMPLSTSCGPPSTTQLPLARGLMPYFEGGGRQGKGRRATWTFGWSRGFGHVCLFNLWLKTRARGKPCGGGKWVLGMGSGVQRFKGLQRGRAVFHIKRRLPVQQWVWVISLHFTVTVFAWLSLVAGCWGHLTLAGSVT